MGLGVDVAVGRGVGVGVGVAVGVGVGVGVASRVGLGVGVFSEVEGAEEGAVAVVVVGSHLAGLDGRNPDYR